MNIWYSYDPEDGYTAHETPEDAREAAEASLEYHRDRSTDGWHDDTINISWGLLVPYGEARECNRVDTPGGEFDFICDYQIVTAPMDDPLEVAHRRLERSTDWYQQRYNALRRWVKEEVEPLSVEVAHRYFAIVANGSPSPHESADWQDTIHGLTLRAERAEQERDEARNQAAAFASEMSLARSFLADAENTIHGVKETLGIEQDAPFATLADAVRAALAEAWRSGAEAMREKCYWAVVDDYYHADIEAIRLPYPGKPSEGKDT